MNKQHWLDWWESSTTRLMSRYRDAWNITPRRTRDTRVSRDNLPKQWGAIRAEVARDRKDVVVHLELPVPHTREAEVRVIGQTLSIAVLRTGNDLERAGPNAWYRRSIPLPHQIEPGTETHTVDGDELVIRMRRKAPRRAPRRSRARAEQQPDPG